MTNLKIFGNHEDNTIEQMKTCMQYGSALSGVLCADGHLGYSHPIGGVIAYKDHISVSGVGFDIGCVDKDTEFLSPTGWVKISEWNGEQVCQYNPDTGIGNYVNPLNYISKPSTGFWHITTKFGINHMVSDDHKLLIYQRRKKYSSNYKTENAKDFCERHNSHRYGCNAQFITAFTMERKTSVPYTDEQLRVIVMGCADGSIYGKINPKIVLGLKKQRKKDRARLLLNEANISFTEEIFPSRPEYTVFKYSPPLVTKTLTTLWNANQHQLSVIGNELLHWDGSVKYHAFYTRKKEDADFVQYVFSATGFRSFKQTKIHKKDLCLDYSVYRLETTKVGIVCGRTHKLIKKVDSKDGLEYCFTVPSGFFITRRGSSVIITGNCGNGAMRLDTDMDDIRSRLPEIMHDIDKEISFGVGRKSNTRINHELFDSHLWKDGDVEHLKELARDQLSTCGSGNHYVDIFEDFNDSKVWIGVHFGSRGLGHKTATKYLKEAGGKDGMNVPPALLEVKTDLGQKYISAMTLASEYAMAGRSIVLETVRKIIGGKVTEYVNNNHNLAWLENHDGEDLWVVRKGATPAFPGQKGFVGGSMGDNAVIIQGVDSELSRKSLYSTVHGAGRVMGRMDAKRSLKHEDWAEWLNRTGVLLRGADLDESPMAYRRLDDVLKHHEGTIEVLHTLKPVVVMMAGNERDPYKD